LAGYFQVWIAPERKSFDRYKNTSWGLLESGGVTIAPGAAYTDSATIMWNAKPQILRPNEGLILTDYAFPATGGYKVKAVVSLPGTENKLESPPIQIVIDEPIGDDLKVWNLIKDNGEIAYFIQNGGVLTSKDDEREKLVKQIEQIVADYPGSILVGQLNQSLEKFRANEIRRKEILEKAKKNPKN